MNPLSVKNMTPHVRSMLTTSQIMFFVILALLPSAGAGIYYYGLRTVLVMGVAVISAVGAELLFELITRKPVTILDYSAALTGFLVGLILPPGVPWYFPMIASFVAIIPAKMLFGGIGRNLFNPALTGKLALLVLFREQMQDYSRGSYSALTPLTQLVNGNTIDVRAMVFGDCAGCIGTGSVIAILAGAVFLLLLGVIDLLIPAAYLGTFLILMSLFGGHGVDPAFLIAQTMGGCMLFTLFFMATDYSTSPVTIRGRIFYGILLGILTALFRMGGIVENACVFAVLIGNLATPLIDRYAMPRPFGTKKRRRVIRISEDK
ncbi:MAG: RnfABCDGE type electron transport complex subunit D [Eubacteriales bacterium]|nr:RnfABCDGE type electron transport complex subunit D [Eubacteriales bacterium]